MFSLRFFCSSLRTLAKDTQGANEILRVVIAAAILSKTAKTPAAPKAAGAAPEPETGPRKRMILKGGTPEEMVATPVENLKKDGHDFKTE